MEDNRIETELWDFKKTLDLWKTIENLIYLHQKEKYYQ